MRGVRFVRACAWTFCLFGALSPPAFAQKTPSLSGLVAEGLNQHALNNDEDRWVSRSCPILSGSAVARALGTPLPAQRAAYRGGYSTGTRCLFAWVDEQRNVPCPPEDVQIYGPECRIEGFYDRQPAIGLRVDTYPTTAFAKAAFDRMVRIHPTSWVLRRSQVLGRPTVTISIRSSGLRRVITRIGRRMLYLTSWPEYRLPPAADLAATIDRRANHSRATTLRLARAVVRAL